MVGHKNQSVNLPHRNTSGNMATFCQKIFPLIAGHYNIQEFPHQANVLTMFYFEGIDIC